VCTRPLRHTLLISSIWEEHRKRNAERVTLFVLKDFSQLFFKKF
jgi:hypothetical protein